MPETALVSMPKASSFCILLDWLNRTVKQPVKIKFFMPLANKLQLRSPFQPADQIDRCRLKANLDEINWFNDFFSDKLCSS